MNKYVKFANKHDKNFKYNSSKLVLSDWNGYKIYTVDSLQQKNLFVGHPFFIKEKDNELKPVDSIDEFRLIMKAVFMNETSNTTVSESLELQSLLLQNL